MNFNFTKEILHPLKKFELIKGDNNTDSKEKEIFQEYPQTTINFL